MDFWNNPIVVSAMRLKYRRSSPGILASVWAMALLAIGIGLHYMALRQPFPVAKTYLLIIFCIQFLVCAVIALVTTSSSMNAEVNNRTLDFQRIVSLSPREILVGKMIGEPAVSYFLVMASVPFAVLCWAVGGGRGSEILFLYLNLATFTLMAAALGVIHSLNPPAPGATRQRGGAGGVVIAMTFVILPQLLVRSGSAVNAPVLGEVLRLFTPVGSLQAFWQGNAWQARVSFWSVPIPSLIVAPLVQLAVAAWIVAAMSRRLKNPVDPAVTKRGAYATAAVFDLALAAVCYSNWRQGSNPWTLAYGFCFTHVVACLLLAFAIVPRHTAVLSWIWRRPPQASPFRDRLLADRAEISLAALVLGLIGVAMLTLFFLPMAMNAQPADRLPLPRFAELAAATVVVIVASAILLQLAAAVPKRGGMWVFVLLMLALNVLPPITGAMLDTPAFRASRSTQEAVVSLSPAGYYIMNSSRWSPDVSGSWLIALYALLGVFSYRLLQRWLRRQTAVVDHKLESMGVRSAAPPAAI